MWYFWLSYSKIVILSPVSTPLDLLQYGLYCITQSWMYCSSRKEMLDAAWDPRTRGRGPNDQHLMPLYFSLALNIC